MKLSRTVGVWIVVGLVPFALAQGTGTSDSSQSATDQPAAMAGGHMMGQQMMEFHSQVTDLFTKLKENLSGLQGENDIDAIHAKIAQQQSLIEQLQSTLNGHCGMSMGMMGPQIEGSQMMHSNAGSMQHDHMMGGGMSGSEMQHSDTSSSSAQTH